MTHKTIDISEDVYKKITDLKQKDESISNFILRLINEKKKKEDRLKSNVSRDIEL